MGSIPLVGSSNKIIFELPINAKAVHNFLFCPPDKELQIQADFSAKPILNNNSLTSFIFVSPPFT